jgi:hypothetical protein
MDTVCEQMVGPLSFVGGKFAVHIAFEIPDMYGSL